MEEVNEFLDWATVTRNSLNSIIENIQEKLPMSEDDLAFIEKAYKIYNEDSL